MADYQQHDPHRGHVGKINHGNRTFRHRARTGEIMVWESKPILVQHRTLERIASMKISQGVSDPQAGADRVK